MTVLNIFLIALVLPQQVFADLKIEKIDKAIEVISRKIDLYRGDQDFYSDQCDQSKTDLKDAKEVRAATAVITVPMIVPATFATGVGIGLLGVEAESTAIVYGSAIAGTGVMIGGPVTELALVMSEGKYERVKIDNSKTKQPTISLDRLMETSTQISPQLMSKRSEFEKPLRDYIVERLDESMSSKLKNFWNLRSINRESASVLLDCSLEKWNRAVVEEFNLKKAELLKIRKSLASSSKSNSGIVATDSDSERSE